MLKNKNELELMELTKEFELYSKEMSKITEKIKVKEAILLKAKKEIAQYNIELREFEDALIDVLRKRQKLNKKIFG